jgi:hypothetical protein
VHRLASSGAGVVAETVNIHTVFLDPDTKGMAGVLLEDEDVAEYCCTEQMKSSGDCGEGVELGGFIVHPGNSTRRPKVATVTLTSAGKQPVLGSNKTEVVVEGPQYVIVAACDAEGQDGVRLPDVALSLAVEFKNPYGYLPGQLYGCARGGRAVRAARGRRAASAARSFSP